MNGVATLAFKDNTKIISVEVPEGMRYIDVSAFEGCTGLKKIILPDSLTWIGGYASQAVPVWKLWFSVIRQ